MPTSCATPWPGNRTCARPWRCSPRWSTLPAAARSLMWAAGRHVTAHLHGLGVDVFGIDLSPAMIDVARRDHPSLHFEVGSMTDLHRPGGPLLLGFHVGDETRLKTHGYGGHPMRVYVHRRQPERVAAWLSDARFTVEAQMLIDLDETAPGAILFARQPQCISV